MCKLSTKSKEILCLVDYVLVVTMPFGSTTYTLGKPVDFPFKRCHICKKHAFVGQTVELIMWV